MINRLLIVSLITVSIQVSSAFCAHSSAAARKEMKQASDSADGVHTRLTPGEVGNLLALASQGKNPWWRSVLYSGAAAAQVRPTSESIQEINRELRKFAERCAADSRFAVDLSRDYTLDRGVVSLNLGNNVLTRQALEEILEKVSELENDSERLPELLFTLLELRLNFLRERKNDAPKMYNTVKVIQSPSEVEEFKTLIVGRVIAKDVALSRIICLLFRQLHCFEERSWPKDLYFLLNCSVSLQKYLEVAQSSREALENPAQLLFLPEVALIDASAYDKSTEIATKSRAHHPARKHGASVPAWLAYQIAEDEKEKGHVASTSHAVSRTHAFTIAQTQGQRTACATAHQRRTQHQAAQQEVLEAEKAEKRAAERKRLEAIVAARRQAALEGAKQAQPFAAEGVQTLHVDPSVGELPTRCVLEAVEEKIKTQGIADERFAVAKDEDAVLTGEAAAEGAEMALIELSPAAFTIFERIMRADGGLNSADIQRVLSELPVNVCVNREGHIEIIPTMCKSRLYVLGSDHGRDGYSQKVIGKLGKFLDSCNMNAQTVSCSR